MKLIPGVFDPQPGDWLFTCRMEPVQFGFWEEQRPIDLDVFYDELVSGAYPKTYTPEEARQIISEIIQPNSNDPDWFVTKDGSSHSAENCGIKPISTRYAMWFTENKMWQWLTFFTDEKVLKEARWVKYMPPHPEPGSTYWYRETPHGVRYHYVRTLGSNKLWFISYDGVFTPEPDPDKCFCYVPGGNLGNTFSVHKDKWYIYESYVKWRAEKEGLIYEGY